MLSQYTNQDLYIKHGLQYVLIRVLEETYHHKRDRKEDPVPNLRVKIQYSPELNLSLKQSSSVDSEYTYCE
jgi:hypothetical protein